MIFVFFYRVREALQSDVRVLFQENSCSAEHNAISKAHLRKEGYIASGIGAVLCARHALVHRNGTGDLQLGER